MPPGADSGSCGAVTWRVLVVDDDITVGMLLSMASDEIEVSDAPRMGDAFGLLSAAYFDAIVVDRRLPDGDGLEFVEKVRSEHSAVDVPIIVITAWFDNADRAEVLTAGADDYLGKPIEPSELVAAVSQAIAMRPARVLAREAARVPQIVAENPVEVVEVVEVVGEPVPTPQFDADLHARLAAGTETIGRLTRENTALVEQAAELQDKLTKSRADNRRLLAELNQLRDARPTTD